MILVLNYVVYYYLNNLLNTYNIMLNLYNCNGNLITNGYKINKNNIDNIDNEKNQITAKNNYILI
ncbi:hypothetical protein J3E06_001687 [Methanococcus voltae]|uniref:Uncharacterized protein n=1 Tax=Methanococcus voltae (strain ATCC BAA-1334 / A3) TaxID=456320 RepID=D7DQN3_METV3|nr:hypothetical protein [Methanococcus voltae]